jgi:hypothetical protein
LHKRPHAPPSGDVPASVPNAHVALPFIETGPAQCSVHEPQLAGCVGSTHVPVLAHRSGVPPSAVQLIAHIPPVHVAAPAPASGPLHTLVHVPQCCGSICVSVHVPPQLSGELPMHPLVHALFAHTGVPESGWHLFPHVPQLFTVVGSTHVPLQSSVVGEGQPASPG